uniref:ubiquitinyl hydrolase 1 n=1 Tax=Chlamydomonas leiostraca TaxID=1034604 RepID=A0A7S0X1T4_9CHLO
MLLKMAYTWRAALGLETPAGGAASAATTLGIDTWSGNKVRESSETRARIEATLHPEVALLVSDEYSFYSPEFVGACSTSCQRARRMQGLPGHHKPYGNISHVMVGDEQQHEPVNGKALHHGAAKEKEFGLAHLLEVARNSPAAAEGRAVFLKFTEVYILQEQHRQISTDGGRTLHELCMFTRRLDHTWDEVATFVDALDGKAILTINDYIPREPTIVVLRNELRAPLFKQLVIKRASFLHKRLAAFRSVDTFARGDLPPAVRALSALLNPEVTDGLPAQMFYFDGIRYSIIDSDLPQLRRVRTNLCTGRALLLDPREPDDSGTADIWELRYLPLGVFVQPDGFDELILITPKATQLAHVALPQPVQLGGQVVHELNLRRRGIPLREGYVVTDFFVQGYTNPKDKTLIMHLNPPPTGPFLRPSLVVCPSRYQEWDDVLLLSHLYNADRSNRHEVITKFHQALQMSPDLRCEIERLTALSQQTRERDQQRQPQQPAPSHVVQPEQEQQQHAPSAPPMPTQFPAAATSSQQPVGPQQPLQQLLDRYEHIAPTTADALRSACQEFNRYRAVQPDGNCFYRGFMFALLEAARTSAQRIRLHARMLQLWQQICLTPALTAGRHTPLWAAAERGANAVFSVLGAAPVSAAVREAATSTDDVVAFARMCTSFELHTRRDRYAPTLTEGTTIADARADVEQMGAYADDWQISALVNALSDSTAPRWCLGIVDVCTAQPRQYRRPDDGTNPWLWMLHLPLHYVILYPTAQPHG